MKLIFLDIDGVFNSKTWEQNDAFKKGSYPTNMFDPSTVALFNKIIEETSAKIVMTSTWRLKFSLAELRQLFLEVGIKGEIIDFTPNLKEGQNYVLRGNEILKWCKDNKDILEVKYIDYTDFAIIDDNSDMLYWQAKNFFQTDEQCGLSPEVTRQVIRSLKRCT